MRRAASWTVTVAMALAGWAAGNPATETDLDAEVGLRASVERLAAPAGAVKLRLSGGAPHEALVLCARGPGGPVLQPLLLDGEGRWERVLSDVELDADVALEFLRRPGGGRVRLAASTRLAARSAAAPRAFKPGAIVITEVMKDPTSVSDSQGEWIEVVNTSMGWVDLEGWTLADLGSNSHTLTNGGLGLPVAPGQRFVLGIQDDPALNGGVGVDYRYSGFTLSNGADEVLLRDAQGAVVDLIAYDDGALWPDTPGVALNLHPAKQTTSLNDDPASWCDASSPIGAGNSDLGTPGGVNSACP